MEKSFWIIIVRLLCVLVPVCIAYPLWLWRERRIRHPRPLLLQPGEFVVHSLMTFSYDFRIRGVHLEHDDVHQGKLILTNRRLIYTSRTQRHQLWELGPADLLKWEVRERGSRWESPALRMGYRCTSSRWFKNRQQVTRFVEWRGSSAELEVFTRALTRWKAGRPLTPAVSPSPTPQSPEVPPMSIPSKPSFVKPAWRMSQLVVAMRSLLIAEIVLSILSFAMGLAHESVIAMVQPEAGAHQVLNGMANDEFAPDDSGMEFVIGFLLLLVLFLGLLALLVATWIGLFFMKPWARWLYLAVDGGGALLGLAFGIFDVSLQWGLSTAVDHIGAQVTGALLALLFLTPLAQQFQPPSVTSV